MLTRTERLTGVHDDLVRVVRRTAERMDLAVLEGVRSVQRERELIAHGASALKDPYRCRHVTGHAVDLGYLLQGPDHRWEVRWDWPLYERLATEMKASAHALGIPIEAGADWQHFRDGPHFQLPWDRYPCQPPK